MMTKLHFKPTHEIVIQYNTGTVKRIPVQADKCASFSNRTFLFTEDEWYGSDRSTWAHEEILGEEGLQLTYQGTIYYPYMNATISLINLSDLNKN